MTTAPRYTVALMPLLAQAPAKVEPIELVEDLHLVFPEHVTPWWVYAVAAAVAVLLAVASWVLWQRRRSRLAAPVPPHTTATQALEDLWKHLPELGAVEYALRVSQILRIYIEGQFGLRAPTRSTQEFLREAEHSQLLGTADRAAVGEFLHRCDVVKFALGDLVMEGKITLHKEAKRFVDETHTAAQLAASQKEEAPALAK